MGKIPFVKVISVGMKQWICQNLEYDEYSEVEIEDEVDSKLSMCWWRVTDVIKPFNKDTSIIPLIFSSSYSYLFISLNSLKLSFSWRAIATYFKKIVPQCAKDRLDILQDLSSIHIYNTFSWSCEKTHSL